LTTNLFSSTHDHLSSPIHSLGDNLAGYFKSVKTTIIDSGWKILEDVDYLSFMFKK